ncbi:ORF6N domain-containing protein [Aliarcobacter butzleri]|uniref:ORF6N domain-containing protein n=1 Tax=Aliarcobacter butzleri TaxID=28197 RepID=UPI001EDC3016|nr:ORF6N domain-containing protein [Aliarcobacter butzleri]MCG3657187.1 ORF6N domain-containing protein [Aliarcobacter butzleri]MDK2051883.1 ORF6N domain-containing protein [Aliarcobacter butzleri]
MNLILEDINSKIYTIRGLQVMLDEDLAKLYDVETKVFNQAVKRNIERFPDNFRFQLTKNEYENLRSQFVTLSLDKGWGTHKKYLPYVFTEQGVSMLSAVLKSNTAIQTSIMIINSFVKMRKYIVYNASIFQRFTQIEQKMITYDENFNKLFSALDDKTLKPSEGIFYDGQIFDSYSFINDLLKLAQKEVILIDNYVDDTVFTLFSKYQNINFIIYTNAISKQLNLDFEKYQTQYKNITLKTFKNSHDRFLILDKKEMYHLGASLKDLGKKWFAFSKMNFSIDGILSKLK